MPNPGYNPTLWLLIMKASGKVLRASGKKLRASDKKLKASVVFTNKRSQAKVCTVYLGIGSVKTIYTQLQ